MTEGTEQAAGTQAKPKTEVEKVTMQDGREVAFAGKRKMLKDTLIDEAGGTVATRFDFRNGETRTFQVPATMLLLFAGHGAAQKIGDETAGEEDVDDMVLAVDKIIERLSKGPEGWNVTREGGGSMKGTSVLMKALMEFSGKPQETIKAYLSDKTPAEKLALRNSKELKPIVERIEAEKAAKADKVDTSALLAGLG